MDDTYRSQFRIPYNLYEQLKAAADKNNRSLNAELVSRLENSFPASISDDHSTKELLIEIENLKNYLHEYTKKLQND